MAHIYCPRYTPQIRSQYSATVPMNGVMIENKKAKQCHYFRGMRDQELPFLINRSFGIGPHDADISLAGRYHGTVIGFWFDPNIHQDETDDDEMMWPVANGLTPDHLDLRSKAKMIRRFGLNPETNWRPYFGPDWSRAFEQLKGDVLFRSMLDSEEKMLSLRLFLSESIKGPGINPYHFIPIFDHLFPDNMEKQLDKLIAIMRSADFTRNVTAIVNGINARASSNTNMRADATDLLQDIIATAFVPFPDASRPPEINIRNLSLTVMFISRIRNVVFPKQMFGTFHRYPLSALMFATLGKPVKDKNEDVYRFTIDDRRSSALI